MGAVRFARGFGEHLIELRWATVGGRTTYSGYPSSTLVRSAGCYGFQFDGRSFSETIVVRITR